MKTLAEAAAAFCEQREQILGVGRQIAAIGDCEDEEAPDHDPPGAPGVPRCTDRLQESGTPWWLATPEEIETFCAACRAKVPLWRERRRMKARLSGLMVAMRAAYRRERKEGA